MYRLAKIKVNAYDELEYLIFYEPTRTIKAKPLTRGQFLNRRIYVSDEERETGLFNDNLENDSAMVERWLIPDGIWYIRTKNIITGERNNYEFNRNDYEYHPIGFGRNVTSYIKNNMKQFNTLVKFSNALPQQLSTEDWPTFTNGNKISVPVIDSVTTDYQKFYMLKYLPTDAKVYYLSENIWQEIKPEQILYRLNKVYRRTAVSFLPIPNNTYVKTITKMYLENGDIKENTTYYYQNESDILAVYNNEPKCSDKRELINMDKLYFYNFTDIINI